jgi:glycosyltransferase involved in cell wall biosynthesis
MDENSQRSSLGIDPARVWLIMPAFNEARVIGDVIDGIRRLGHRLVAVDDGSTDATWDVVRAREWVDLLRHPVNLGQGAALQTGITYALAQGAKWLVTFDSDGQHDPAQVADLLRPIVEGRCQAALGSRFSQPSADALAQIPRLRRLMLKAATIYTRAVTGLKITDVHNGFRAFTAEAARQLDIRQNRMAHASEILSQIAKRRIPFVEVPVTIRYTEYSLSKGQGLGNAFNILWEIILGKMGRQR